MSQSVLSPWATFRQVVLFIALSLISYDLSAQCKEWQTAGSTYITSGGTAYHSMAAATTGEIYIAYQDQGGGHKATVQKYNGSSWSTVGAAGFSDSSAYNEVLKLDNSNTPYVVYSDMHAGAKATVKKYNGSSWVTVGASGFTAASSSWWSLAIDGAGVPYIAYPDSATGKAMVKKYNGSTWVTVGSAGFSAGTAGDINMFINATTGDPYVCFSDGANGGKVTVMKYDGSSWSIVGAAGISPGTAHQPILRMNSSGSPYVACEDYTTGTSVVLMSYSAGTWTVLDGNYNSGYTISDLNFQIDNTDALYVGTMASFSGSSAQPVVKKFSGTSWDVVGQASFSPGATGAMELVIDPSGTLWASYRDNTSGGKASVKKLTTLSAISGVSSLCVGATATFSLNGMNGTWSSWAPSIATVGSVNGVVTAVAGGVVTISYTVGSCSESRTLTVSPNPGSISGPLFVTVGNSIALSNYVAGGIWSTSNSNAIITSGGVLTGVAAGSTTVSYAVTGSCGTAYDTKVITIAPVSPSCYSWSLTGSSALSPAYVNLYDIQMDGFGVPYIAYNYYDSGPHLEIKKYNGSEWVSLHVDAVIPGSGSMTVAPSGVVYAVGGSTYTSNTYKYQDNVWSEIPSPDENDGAIIKTDAAGSVYETYYVYDYTLGDWELKLGKFNGTTWDSLGTVGHGYYPQVTFSGTTPYIMFQDSDNGDNVTVRRYNGSSWETVGTAFSTTDIFSSSFVVDNSGVVYVCLLDGGFPQVWKCSSGSWADAGLDPHQVWQPRLSKDGDGVLYLTGQYEEWPYYMIMLKYNGATWDAFRSISYGASMPSAAVDANGNIFVLDNTDLMGVTYGATVWKYAPDSALPPISGVSTLCYAETTSMSDTHPGGFWTSSNPMTLGLDPSNPGLVMGGYTGTATISYTSGTCSATHIVTVGPTTTPDTVAGTLSICSGGTSTLSTTTSAAGGDVYWWSDNESVAVIDGYAGIVTGLSAGAANITCEVWTSCGPLWSAAIVTVNPVSGSVDSITGTSAVCVGGTTTLVNATAGGSWSSSNPSVAAIGSATGVVTGGAVGTATIIYAVSSGCGAATATTIVTVNGTPSAGSITGTATVCTGNTTTLANAATGGAWSSSNTSVATIGSATGIVSGLSAGGATITYTVSSACGSSSITAVVTVNGTPSAGSIIGTASVCTGNTTTLSNATAGGTWSSSNSSVAAVGSATGIVSGVAAGNASITYTVANSCGAATTTAMVTVNSTPIAGTITGTAVVCTGNTTTLNNATTGGTWSSSNTSVASVGSASGIVSGIATGNATVTYTVTSACGSATTTKVVTVNAATSAGTITGAGSICTGSTLTLGNTVTGGTWSSSNSAVATVGSSTGIVTGVSSGNAAITYTVSGACGSATATAVVTVGTSASITGSLSLCAGMTSTLSGGTSGGTWTSSNTAVATIGSTTGVLTAVATGISNITYSLGSGCTAIAVANVSQPASIGGTSNVCVGLTATLTDATSGGTWTSSNTSLATVDASTGEVTGVAAGTATISYVVSAGCYRTISFTVKSNPPAVATPVTVCVGNTASIPPPSSNGLSWTSSNTTIATIGSSSGVLTGIAAGTTILTYTTITGCYVTTEATVNAVPSITGTTTLCAGGTSSLSCALSGGAWSSSNSTIASVGSSTGVVTGVASGNATITYTTNGCRATAAVFVTPFAAIAGALSTCLGSSTTLSNSTGGGTWSSSNSAIATVGSTTGIVTGVTGGNATITYTIGSGCSRTAVVTVVATSGAISGTLTVCPGFTTTLTGGTSGGTWSGGNATIATINSSTGVVSGIGAGTINVSYTLSGCRATAMATVNALPASITGTVNACVDQTSALADVTAGGAWSSNNTSIAAVDASTGVVTGVSATTTTITYTLATGCYKTVPFTVKALPPAIASPVAACVGTSTSIAPPSTNGKSWSSSNTAVATIGSSNGIMTGVSTGTTILTYTATTGCFVTTEATVYALPNAGTIIGPSSVVVGSTMTLDDAASGGVWSSGTPARATVGSATGIVTGIAGGPATISYSVSNPGCTVRATQLISVLTSRPGSSLQSPVGSMQLYPNPTTGAFTVEVEEAGTFSIFSLDGREVSRHNISKGFNQLTLSNEIANGIYMCRYISESGNTTMVRLVYER